MCFIPWIYNLRFLLQQWFRPSEQNCWGKVDQPEIKFALISWNYKLLVQTILENISLRFEKLPITNYRPIYHTKLKTEIVFVSARVELRLMLSWGWYSSHKLVTIRNSPVIRDHPHTHFAVFWALLYMAQISEGGRDIKIML